MTERETKRLTFLAEIKQSAVTPRSYFRLTRKNFCTRQYIGLDLETQIIDELGRPADDEEIIVTFTKRKKPDYKDKAIKSLLGQIPVSTMTRDQLLTVIGVLLENEKHLKAEAREYVAFRRRMLLGAEHDRP
jgi:hypothetical protein